jgi:alpha-galactosidase
MGRWNRRQFMQASAASLSLNGFKLNISPDSRLRANDATSTFVRTNAAGKSWTVGNDLVERQIEFDPKRGLSTPSWRHKVTGTEFMRAEDKWGPQGHEFTLRLDGVSLSGVAESAWDFLEAKKRDVTPAGKSLVIHLRSKAKPIDVAVFYAVYDGHAVVQKWIAITNRGKSPVTISHLAFESLGIAAGPPNAIQVSGFYASQPRELFYTGRVDDTAVLERNSLTGEGFIALNGAPGYTKRTELTGWGEGLHMMYDTDLFPFERRLHPGETFISAKSSIAFFCEGKGFADPRWVMPSYTSQCLMKKGRSYQPPWIYNTWEPFERGITKEITMDLIAAAGRMGMDIFTIDDGWQANYGENAINFKLFPNGLDEIQAAVERQGMRP